MEYRIRAAAPGDGKGINAIRTSRGAFENTMGLPSEHITRSEDFVATSNPHLHSFVAVIDLEDGSEMIIGHAGLHTEANPRRRHSGSIGMMIHPNFQGKGVGTKLLDTLLDLADNWLMLVRVELSVFYDNDRAIHLYEKKGFEREGVKRKTSVRNGEYVDEIIMGRIRHIEL